MAVLSLAPRLSDPDALFAALVAAHEGLPDAASRRLDAKLVLLLANHIGDAGVVLDALRVAQATDEPAEDGHAGAPAGPAAQALPHPSPEDRP